MSGRTIPAECQASVRAYAEKKADNVVSSAVGTSFNSVDERYVFYNLYS